MNETKKKEVLQPSPLLVKILDLVNLVDEEIFIFAQCEISKRTAFAEEGDLKNAFSDVMKRFKEWNEDYPFHHQIVEIVKEEMSSYPNFFSDLHTAFAEIRKCDQFRMSLEVFDDEYDMSLIPQFNPNDYFSQHYNYKQFIRIRSELHFTIHGVQMFMEKTNSRSKVNDFLMDRTFSSQLFVTKDQVYDFKQDIVALALRNTSWARLRICRKCQRFFWATRIDKYGCSAKCGNSIRTKRKHRKDAKRFPSRVETSNSTDVLPDSVKAEFIAANVDFQ